MSKLSIKGAVKTVQNGSGVKQVFDWAEAAADAAILSGLCFFGALIGQTLTGANCLDVLLPSGVAAGFQFFSVLALKRGLVSKK